jgi:hypothetical protein
MAKRDNNENVEQTVDEQNMAADGQENVQGEQAEGTADQAQADAGAKDQADTETKIREAFDAAHAAGKEEDEVKLDMIGAGATFKNVTRLFNQFSVDAGLTVSKEEKDQIINQVLSGADLSTEESFNAKVAELQASLQGSTDKSAAALVRAYAKKNGLEVFKKAKGAAGESKTGFAAKFYDWLAANPTSSVEEATAFIQGTNGHEETSENVKRHQSHYLGVHRLVNRVAGVAV